MSTPGTSRTTTAFYAQAGLAFGIALLAVVLGICYLPVDPWQRAALHEGVGAKVAPISPWGEPRTWGARAGRGG